MIRILWNLSLGFFVNKISLKLKEFNSQNNKILIHKMLKIKKINE